MWSTVRASNVEFTVFRCRPLSLKVLLPFLLVISLATAQDSPARRSSRSVRSVIIAVLFVPVLIAICWCFWCCWRACSRVERDEEDQESHILEGSSSYERNEEQGVSTLATPSNAPTVNSDSVSDKLLIELTVVPKKYSYTTLLLATDNFSDSCKLGEGKYGVVYKADVGGPGGAEPRKTVAVKRFKSGSVSSNEKDILAELNVLGNINHNNLVQLIGWSYDPAKADLLLVYEYVPNGTLHKHLLDTETGGLSLPDRSKIAYEIALAVQHLHEKGDRCVIHRDIKPQNIMMTEKFTPKLGDFGVARLTDHGKSMEMTKAVGSLNYVAPEILHLECKASTKSDVYSYGVVLLQIVTGRPSQSEEDGTYLFSWVWGLHKKSRLYDAVDSKLGRLSASELQDATFLLLVGLYCCQPDPSKRPQMREVIKLLEQMPNSPPDVPLDPDWSIYPWMKTGGTSSTSSQNFPAEEGADGASSSGRVKNNSPPAEDFVPQVLENLPPPPGKPYRRLVTITSDNPPPG